MSVPEPRPRKPLRYHRPRTSWAALLLLVLAAIGLLALGFLFSQEIRDLVLRTPPPAPPGRPVVWKPLPMDDAVLVTIEVHPRGAQLLLDGEPAPSNPLRLPRGTRSYKIAALAEGYEPATAEFTADAPKTVRLRLRRPR